MTTPRPQRRGLGRGLGSLIPTSAQPAPESTVPRPEPASETLTDPARPDAQPPSTATADAPVEPGEALAPVEGAWFAELPIGRIVPNAAQPRQVFDEEALSELEHSIREFGLMQPIVIREIEAGQFELIMGERRWRAAQRAGLENIPAIVRETQDDALLRDALLENIHRVQLNPLEEAAAYQQLLDEFDVTHDELADRIGRSRPVITNTIRLLRLPMPVQRRVAAGVLSAGHARALLSLDEPEGQEELATRIVAEGLSVRATEEAVTLKKGEDPTKPKQAPRKQMQAPGLQGLAERMSDRLDTKVKVELGRRKGRIVIEFGSVDDLERLAELILGEKGRSLDDQ